MYLCLSLTQNYELVNQELNGKTSPTLNSLFPLGSPVSRGTENHTGRGAIRQLSYEGGRANYALCIYA